VSGPGDRASKRLLSRGPTHSSFVEGHGGGPCNVDLDPPSPPGLWSSARSYTPRARESGDLGGVGGEAGPQTRAGRRKPQSAAVLRGVGRARSTNLKEVGERVGNARGVDGGKGRGQRDACSIKTHPGLRTGPRRAYCWSRPDSERRRFDVRRPKVGARCGKSARRVLSGGRPERAVPTGTLTSDAYMNRILEETIASLAIRPVNAYFSSSCAKLRLSRNSARGKHAQRDKKWPPCMVRELQG